jgi:predicted glycosyltransferase
MLHCHDSYGIGHLRRTLTLATALRAAQPELEILITSGSPCATHFELPEGVDIIKVPSVTKGADGSYVPRSLGTGLGTVVRMRRRLLLETFRAFQPHLVLADHQPLGLCGELTDVLEGARQLGTPTILGLRDIIDEPAIVAEEWARPDIRHAITNLYTKLVVYGREEVFDIRREYQVPNEWKEKTEFTGYVVRDAPINTGRAVPSIRPVVLVTIGGGEDGCERIDTYLQMLEQSQPVWNTCMVLGPLFPQRDVRRVKRRARMLNGLEVHSFHRDIPRLLAQCDAVVSMAGYNSVTEIMQSGKPVVFWPRTHPRREQLIRAERLELRGVGACVAEPTPMKLRRELELALERGGLRPPRGLLGGCDSMCRIVQDMLSPGREEVSQKVV